jgi:hypothetical protein
LQGKRDPHSPDPHPEVQLKWSVTTIGQKSKQLGSRAEVEQLEKSSLFHEHAGNGVNFRADDAPMMSMFALGNAQKALV